MKLVAAALVLLSISGCSAEVVNDFSRCGDFFADPNGDVSPPTTFNGDQYRKICQTLNNKAEYATYYDTTNRIPVYSAYRFYGSGDCDRKGSWSIEPQLHQRNEDKNMRQINSDESYGTNQALNSDYAGSCYDKGHLVPVYLSSTQSCSDATFTLTNAAPQNPSFNRGQWKVAEKKLSNFLKTKCVNVGLSAYVVTGVVPGNTLINDRVNVPSYFWSSYCCLDNNKKPQYSGGFYGENENKCVLSVSVSELEDVLKKKYDTDSFKLFGNGCNVMHRDFNLDRSETEIYFGSISRKRSRLEHICAKRFAYSSSTRYGDQMCFGLANSRTILRTKRMCKRHGFFRSGSESPVEDIYPRRIVIASSTLNSRVADICGRYFGYSRSLIEEHDD